MRAKSRQRASREARAALEDWIELLIDQIRTVFSTHTGVPDHSLALFIVKESDLPASDEILDELERVTLSTPSTHLDVERDHPDFPELVECWDELRNALGALYRDVVPPAMVVELRTHTFLLYEPTHFDAAEAGPLLVGAIEPPGSPEHDPFLELLTDHEADFDALVERVEGVLLGRGLSTPSNLVDDV